MNLTQSDDTELVWEAGLPFAKLGKAFLIMCRRTFTRRPLMLIVLLPNIASGDTVVEKFSTLLIELVSKLLFKLCQVVQA